MRLLLISLLLSGTALAAPTKTAPALPPKHVEITVQWPDLVPPEDRRKLVNPGNVDHGRGPDQPRDIFSSQEVFDALDAAANPPPIRTVKTYHGRKIKLPGYIVPVDYNKQGKITVFYLVPYFGACLHLPPPPPNQIVYVRYPQGFEPAALYDPFWVSGELRLETLYSAMADSGYSMKASKITPYTGAAR